MIFNEEIETINRVELEKLQLERLKNTLDSAYNNVQYYRDSLDEANVSLDDIKSIKDIEKLPFLNKGTIRDNYPYNLLAVQREEISRIHASSGTSGKPTIAAYTKSDIDMWAEVVARAIGAAGGKLGDIVHNAYGYGLFTGGLGIHYGVEKFGAIAVPVSTGNTSRQILMIQDLEPEIICATPSYALHLAEVMMKQGINPKETSLKYGIFGAETWSEEMRKLIEETFDIKAVDIYGLSEVVGPGVSIECVEGQNGLHVQEDHFYVEVIDPDTLEVLPEGEYGELVFTSLTKEAFPVLRYRTGDIAALTYDKCECGRTTVRMSRPKGRVDDMLIIKGVNVFPSEVERSLLQVDEISPNYQLHLTKSGHVDEVQLAVEVSEEFLRVSAEELQLQGSTYESIKRKVQMAIRNECLINLKVDIVEPNSLPRSEGKAVRIVDDRNTETVKR